jgi:hypothetical protein
MVVVLLFVDLKIQLFIEKLLFFQLKINAFPIFFQGWETLVTYFSHTFIKIFRFSISG